MAPSSKDFLYWRLVANEYPYDAIATTHTLLVPKRHTPTLNDQETQELRSIKRLLEIDQSCDAIIENVGKTKTLPTHYHLHLLTWIRT